ncbi:MAG: hypothetical protein LBL04_14085 [Bacteroidales bacterium]|jgi:hypothetical protein|nr:hypothetical protein [Bacteroidales bacterium]
MNTMNSDWKALLSRRLRAEAQAQGYRQVDVCNIRAMETRPVKMYAVVVADCAIYVVTGHSENEMASGLRERIALQVGYGEKCVAKI